MATLKNERYLRYILLLGEGGLLVLRRIVRREETKNGQPLKCILSCNRASFDNILREQYEKLFPRNSTVNDDIQTWDTSILMTVVRRLFWVSLSKDERKSIRVLQTCRNEIQAHPTELCMEAADYEVNTTDVSDALIQLAAGDQSTIDEVNNIISKADSSGIDINSTIRHVQELNEFKNNLLKALESRFDMIISGISQSHFDRLYRIKVIKQKQQAGKALKTIIQAKCDNKEKERKALELLLDFVELVQQKNELTQAEIIQSIKQRIEWYGELTTQLLDDILDWFTDLKDLPDANPGPAQMGSILIPIHLSSLTGLLEHMTYMLGDNSRSRLSAISCTVSKILKFPCSFSWSVLTEDLQAVMTVISAQSKTDKSTVSRKIVLPFQTMSLKGLTGIWRQFGDGRRNLRLVKISETLSKILGAPISLTTSVDDLKQCVEPLFILETTKAGSKEKTKPDPANITEEVESTQSEETKQEQVNVRNSEDTKAFSKEKTELERDPPKCVEEVEATQSREAKQEQVNVRNSEEEICPLLDKTETIESHFSEEADASTSQKDTKAFSKEKTELERDPPKCVEGTASRLDSSGDLKCVIAKQERVKIVHYTALLKGWPGMDRTQRSIRRIADRCSHLENELGMSQQSIDTSKDVTEIDIYISSSLNLDPLSLPPRPEYIQETGTVFLGVSERTDEAFPLRQKFLGIFIDNRGVKMVEAISSEQIGVVIENAEDNESTTDNSILDLSQIKQQLNAILERVVFETLTEKFNFLKDLHQNMILDKSSKLGNSVLQLTGRIEHLLGESIALFKLSSLPADKRPVATGYQEKDVSKEVKEELFRLDDTIHGCGYSYGTFNVNVEDLSDEEKNLKRKIRITDLLGKYGINNVKFNIVAKSVSEYKRVGEELCLTRIGGPHVSVRGTLGCFASITLEESTSLCLLFAKHIPQYCSGKVYVNDNGQVIELGSTLEESVVSEGVDIAAAKIHQEHVAKCDVAFKNSENVPLPGKLLTSDDDYIMEGLPVHLWGARSKPGYGIITIPKLTFPGVDNTFIQLEDRDMECGATRLAVEGDSGAVVCADDPGDEYVYVISMLVGAINDEIQLKNPTSARKYISFFLQTGVKELQSRIKRTVTLKGISNDKQG